MTRPLLAFLVALGCVLRAPGLHVGLWRDEGSTYFDIVPASLAGVVKEVRLAEFSPPLYFLGLHLWTALAGTSEIALRLPSLVFGLALIPATYALARLVVPRKAALLAAGFAALSTVGVTYSDEARPYALAALLSAAVTALALRAQTGARDDRILAAYVAAAVLLAYVHYAGLFVIVALGIAALPQVVAAGTRPRALAFLGAEAVVALAYLPWMRVLFPIRHDCFAFLAPLGAGAFPGRFIEQLGFALPVVFMHSQYATALAIACALTVFAKDVRLRCLSLTVLLVTFAETQQLLREARYMFVATPLVDALLASYCAYLARPVVALVRERTWPRTARLPVVAGVALALTLLAGIPAQSRAYAEIARAQARSGMRAMTENNHDAFDSRTLVIVAPDYLGSSLRYYVRGRDIRVAGIPAWDAPEHVRCMPGAWRSPGLVDDAVTRIAGTAAQRYARIAFVWGPSVADRGDVPYSLVLGLRKLLQERFAELADHRYAGSLEPVGLTVFATDMRSPATSRRLGL